MHHATPTAAAIRSRVTPTAVKMAAAVSTDAELDSAVLTLDPSVRTGEGLGPGVGTTELGPGVGSPDGQLEAFAHEMVAVRCNWHTRDREMLALLLRDRLQ